jgi:hypothetical protein
MADPAGTTTFSVLLWLPPALKSNCGCPSDPPLAGVQQVFFVSRLIVGINTPRQSSEMNLRLSAPKSGEREGAVVWAVDKKQTLRRNCIGLILIKLPENIEHASGSQVTDSKIPKQTGGKTSGPPAKASDTKSNDQR